jgi:hypothetical protein
LGLPQRNSRENGRQTHFEKTRESAQMKQRKKSDLPEKICLTCQRPFTWRKKWEKVWDEVKYCSDRCRTNKNNA